MTPLDQAFILGLALSILIGFIIGVERESRGKDAGISTHILVIAGAMLFSLLSHVVDPGAPSRIAAGVVTGIGFLGAGLIFHHGDSVKNLTTAASLWCAAAIGMALGYGYYFIALFAGVAAAVIPRIPSLHSRQENH